MTTIRLLPLIAIGLIAACEQPYSVSARACNMRAHQALVGKNIGEVTLPPALTKRIISPGDAVTEDFNPARLNLYVDPKGWIGRVSCG